MLFQHKKQLDVTLNGQYLIRSGRRGQLQGNIFLTYSLIV